MKREIWKDVVGYEGIYKVSNYGRVKSLDRYVGNKYKNGLLFKKGRIMKQTICNGYYSLTLSKENVKEQKSIHRLKGFAFMSNPDNRTQINHRDGNKLNNGYHIDGKSNLEWATPSENGKHAYRVLGIQCFNKGKLGKLCAHSKIVYQYTREGKGIKRRDAIADIERTLGFKQQAISACCRGERKTAYNFIWSYI